MPETWDVLVPSIIDDETLSTIRDFARIHTYEADCTKAELIDALDGCEAFVHRTVVMDADVLEAATELKVIAKHGVGVDLIDVETASERGIVVCNAPGSNARAVAEMAITLLLAAWKDLLPADEAVRTGEWDSQRHRSDRPGVPNVEGATLGLFGCGNISSKTAAIGRGFGMSLVGFDPYVPVEGMPDGVEKVDSKAELFDRADAVSVHVPITEETRGAIAADELERLGPEGIIVNTARGGVVSEAALLDALESGAIRAAGLDVFEREPPEEDNPLFDREDVVLSPHVAGASIDSHRQMGTQSMANVRAVYEGDVPDTAVNGDEIERS